jgi:hypothetical protein
MKIVRAVIKLLLIVSGLWALGGVVMYIGYPDLGTPRTQLESAVVDFGPLVVAAVLWAFTRRRSSN